LVAISGGASASFQYDPFGRRVSKPIGGTTQYLYDGANPVQEISGSSASANLLAGGVDEYFQRTDSAGARNFLSDALGSTLALADSTGTVQTQYTFEPFGNTSVTGAATTNSFAYTGRELDSTGLYFYRARYYNPTLQRFVSEDPIGFVGSGDTNLYAYVGNNPIAFLDHFGLDKNTHDARCPGRLASGITSGLINSIPAFAATHLLAVASGHVVTVGYDANLTATWGTFGLSAHAGDALAFDPKGNIAVISTTGAGGGFGGDVALTGQVGYMRATSLFELRNDSTLTSTFAYGEGLAGSASSDLEGNLMFSLGTGFGVATAGTYDEAVVRIIACHQ
jgi:RHS repeat-associated protein